MMEARAAVQGRDGLAARTGSGIWVTESLTLYMRMLEATRINPITTIKPS